MTLPDDGPLDAQDSKPTNMTDGTAHTPDPESLAFASDTGAKTSTWTALGITLVIIGWMGSGFFLPAEVTNEEVVSNAPLPIAVSVRQSDARPVTLFFNAEGQALPDRDTEIRAEASGQITEIIAGMGDFVEEGAVIARLDSEEAEANLAQALQEVARTTRDLENAETLLERGVATVDRIEQARSALVQAQSQLTAAESAIANSTIVAPFDGRIEVLDLDPGEFIQTGATVGRIVDNSPLTVSFQVPQQSLTRLESGQTATVTFITGEEREAVVTFVGTSAAQATRTFLAEVSLPNEDGAIAAGLSAEISIPTNQIEAHFLSPSIVSLNSDGQLGVKTVDDEDIVHFYAIEVVSAEIDGIWVTGLPDSIRLITIGQGYVNDGDTVRPQIEDAS